MTGPRTDTKNERPEDPEEYYDRELIGLKVRTTDGVEAGEVIDVVHLPSQDLLEIRRPAGNAVLVPLVEELVPEIDLGAQYVVVADKAPAGGQALSLNGNNAYIEIPASDSLMLSEYTIELWLRPGVGQKKRGPRRMRPPSLRRSCAQPCQRARVPRASMCTYGVL